MFLFFLRQRGIATLSWTSSSPDLNPIENFWDLLERRVRDNHLPPQTLQQPFGFLQIEWQAIPQARIRRFIDSMRRCCNECIHFRGGNTHYWCYFCVFFSRLNNPWKKTQEFLKFCDFKKWPLSHLKKCKKSRKAFLLLKF